MARKVAVSVRLDAHQRDQVKGLAHLLEMSESEVLRLSLERGLQFLIQGRPEDEVLRERLAQIRLGKEQFISEGEFRKKYGRRK